MIKIEYQKIEWWYWLVSWALVVWGLMGEARAFVWVTALTFIQIIHFGILEKSFKAFSVQVRAALFFIFLIGFIPGFGWIYWWPAVGLVARILFSYCFLARTLSLFPWLRKEPLSLNLIKKTYFTPPTTGPFIPK